MNEYGRGVDARAGLGGLLLVIAIAIAVAGLLLVPEALGNLEDAKASRELAKAEVIRAETAADHQASVDWQRDFMLWTVAMKASGGDLLAVVVLGLAALIGGYALGQSRGPNARR